MIHVRKWDFHFRTVISLSPSSAQRWIRQPSISLDPLPAQLGLTYSCHYFQKSRSYSFEMNHNFLKNNFKLECLKQGCTFGPPPLPQLGAKLAGESAGLSLLYQRISQLPLLRHPRCPTQNTFTLPLRWFDVVTVRPGRLCSLLFCICIFHRTTEH